nr:non-structural polyprotein [Crow astrovirus]
MAFASAAKRAERMDMQIGLSKLTPLQGTVQLFKRMKQLYGNTNAWRDLMRCDAVALENMNAAWGTRDDRFFNFTATKVMNGWDVKFSEAKPTEEVEIMLRAQASNAITKRYHATMSSARADEILQLQQKLREKATEIKELHKINEHHMKEIAHLRKVMQHESTVSTAPRLNKFYLVLILFLAFMYGARAEDCTRPVKGCYLDTTKPFTRAYTWQDIQLYCSGETTVTLPALGVNIPEIENQCEEYLQKNQMNPGASYRDWCKETLQQTLHTVACAQETYGNHILTTVKAVYGFLRSKNLLPFMKTSFVIATMIMHFWRTNYAGVVMTLVLTLKTRYNLLNVLRVSTMCTEYIVASALTPLTGILTTDHIIVTFFVTMTSITARFLLDGLHGVSQSALSALLMTCFDVTEFASEALEVDEILHFMVTPIILVTIAGLNYTMSSVTIVKPDGTVEKKRNIELPKNLFLKVQNAVRGVIPHFPDRANQVVVVESDVGTGVGWRFMNNIYTLKHVVGGSKVVKLSWGAITVRANVEAEIPLYESVDSLVKIKLPPELQGLKPFRLVKQPKSDYLTLISMDLTTMQPITYTGWNTLDGVWLTNTFETKPGDSGAPYMDRNGRLVGVHMGTQGVVAQGYALFEVLHNMKPLAEQTMTPAMDEMLYKLIDGTKRSHAALTTTIEQLIDKVNMLEKKLQEQPETVKQPILEEKKKQNKKRISALRARFSRIKVLTEEQYQEMLDKGWTKEEIDDAITQLRDRAFMDYLIEHEDDLDADDFDAEKYFDEEVMNYESKPIKEKRGFVTTAKIDIIEQKKRKRVKPYVCRYCKKTYTTYHDIHKCRKTQDNAVSVDTQKEEKDQKNLKKGDATPPSKSLTGTGMC